MKLELKKIETMYDLHTELNFLNKEVEYVWDTLPYSYIEKWFNILVIKVELENRNDEYSQTIYDICKSCLKRNKVSIRQFKCVMDYVIRVFHKKNLKYKHKQ